MTATIEERVARGATMLDKRNPGWENKLDLGKLNIRNCNNCVLGQLYGGYANGTMELGLQHQSTVSHGFWGDIDPSWDNTASVQAEYDRLNAVWVRAIEERREMRALEADVKIEEREKVDA